MHERFSVVCEEQVAAEIEALAREHDLSREEVIRQLITVGLEEVDGHRGGRPRKRLLTGRGESDG